jgi:hypothetical protein
MKLEKRTKKKTKQKSFKCIYLFLLFQNTIIFSKYRIKQLLSFDDVNVWIYWLLKKNDIDWARIDFWKKINKPTHLHH